MFETREETPRYDWIHCDTVWLAQQLKDWTVNIKKNNFLLHAGTVISHFSIHREEPPNQFNASTE